MARLARKQLADQRAMEEESLRLSLHGGSKYVGRGATPSMGLSQFRGGAVYTKADAKRDSEIKRLMKKLRGGACECEEDSSSEEEDEMTGGRSFISRLPTAGLSRGRPIVRAPTLPTITRPPISRPYTEIPSFPKPNLYPGRQFVGPRLVNPPRGVTTAVNKLGLEQGRRAKTVFNAANAKRIAALLSAGVPFAMLGAYLGDMGGDGGGGGFYDDYAGDDGGGGPSGPSGPDTDGDGIPDDVDPDDNNDGIPDAGGDGGGGDGGLPADIADQLTRTELAFYLQSGNLPNRFYQQAKRGKGREKKEKQKRKPSARNEVVKQVMRERGCSLPEASKIVKAEGLYKK